MYPITPWIFNAITLYEWKLQKLKIKHQWKVYSIYKCLQYHIRNLDNSFSILTSIITSQIIANTLSKNQNWVYGVVVSRSLCMRKASGSIPDISINFFKKNIFFCLKNSKVKIEIMIGVVKQSKSPEITLCG